MADWRQSFKHWWLAAACAQDAAPHYHMGAPHCDAHPPAAAAGYHVLSISGPGNLDTDDCALGALSYANPYLFQKCSISPADTTYLSVYVDQYCAGERWPGLAGASRCAAP